MRIFMLGWEFPPFICGGLGTACHGLTKALDRLGIKVTFVLPRMVDSSFVTHVKLLTPQSRASKASFSFSELKNVKFRTIPSTLQPYTTPDIYRRRIEESLRQRQQTSVGRGGAAPHLIGGMQ